MAIVYQHIRKIDGVVFYIGIGKIEKRAYSKNSRSKFWRRYTAKTEYLVMITHKDICWEEACSIEKYLISFYGRRDLGLGTLVNVTDGGEGISNPSEDIRKRISQTSKGRNNRKGKKHSEETKKRISEAHKDKKHSEETKKIISKIHKDKSVSAETRKKQSEAHKGKKHSEETKIKLKKAWEIKKQKNNNNI